MKEKYSEKLIIACLEYQKDSEIAKATGIARQTICKYRKDPEFQKLIDDRKIEYVRTAVTKMQTSLSRVVEEVLNIIDDPATAPQVRLNACQLILTNCARWTDEIEVLSRLKTLEDKVNEE